MFWNRLSRAGKRLSIRSGLTIALLTGCLLLHLEPAIAAPNAVQLGAQAIEQHNYPTAIEQLDRAIEQGQNLEQAYGHRCIAHLLLNQPEQAAQSCAAAAKLNPDYPQVAFYQGLAHYRLGQFAAAIADFNRHLQAQPEDARAFYNCGLAAFALGDVAGAISQYHQALTFAADLTPFEMSNLYNDLGVAYLSSQRQAEARVALDQAVALGTDDVRAYFNRGCICHHQGQYAEALQDFDRVLKLDPYHAETYLNRGIVQQQLGHVDAARQDFRLALKQFTQQRNAPGVQQAKLRLQQLSRPPSAVG